LFGLDGTWNHRQVYHALTQQYQHHEPDPLHLHRDMKHIVSVPQLGGERRAYHQGKQRVRDDGGVRQAGNPVNTTGSPQMPGTITKLEGLVLPVF